MSYPDECIRGISDVSCVTEDKPTSHLFNFKDENNRSDGWCEQSINWKDDEYSIQFTLKQQKNGDVQFKVGIAIISRDQLDKLNRRPAIAGILSYERDALENNQYHGNLLLKTNTPKPIRKMVAAGIALAVETLIKQP